MSVKKADQRLLPVGLPLRLDRYEEEVVTSVTATCAHRRGGVIGSWSLG